MVRLLIISVITCSLMAIGSGESLFEDSKPILPTSFCVYLYVTKGGLGENSYVVGQANITPTSPTRFGLFRLADDLITTRSNLSSQVLGQSEGTLINSGLNEMSITLNFDFVFTAGPYQRSSLTLLGGKLLTGQNQEVPIVGGTSAFRLARGYTISNIYYDDNVTTISSYDIYISGLLF